VVPTAVPPAAIQATEIVELQTICMQNNLPGNFKQLFFYNGLNEVGCAGSSLQFVIRRFLYFNSGINYPPVATPPGLMEGFYRESVYPPPTSLNARSFGVCFRPSGGSLLEADMRVQTFTSGSHDELSSISQDKVALPISNGGVEVLPPPTSP
jgi:hypothetical protein